MEPINWQARAREAGASVRLLSELTGYGRETVRRTLGRLTAWEVPAKEARAIFGAFGRDYKADAIRAAIMHKERENEARQAFAAKMDRVSELRREVKRIARLPERAFHAPGVREAGREAQVEADRILEAILENVSKSTQRPVTVTVLEA